FRVIPGAVTPALSGDRLSILGPLVHRPRQAKILAESSTFIFGAEEAAALQFRNNLSSEVAQSFRERQGQEVEAVAGAGCKPFLERIRDHSWRAQHGTMGTLADHPAVELPDCHILA